MRYLLIGLVLLLPHAARASELSCPQLPAIMRAFELRHYAHPALDAELQKRVTEQFIKAIDPSKTALLQSDVDALRANVPQVFATMRQGDCAVLDQAFALIIKRAEEDQHVAEHFLGEGYKLDENVQIVVDPDKRGFAKTEAERAARLKDYIHFQISNLLTAGQTLPQAKKQLAHRYALVVKRLRERQEKGSVVSAFADAFAEGLDPHSSFMSASQLANFQIEMHLSLEGIGAVLSSQDGFTVIESLVPGGAADKTGKLRPKDKIVAVAQKGKEPVQTLDMDLDSVVKMIRGPKGTAVTLTVLREGENALSFQQTIVRDKVDVSSRAAKIDYQQRKVGDRTLTIGVIDLPSFYGGEEDGRWSHRDVKALLEQAKAKKVDGVVLDLSRNGGGLLEEAVRISGLFIKKGAVVGTLDSTRQMQVLDDEDSEVVYAGPLVVLTSPLSASASEILSGALQDYHRALIVGGTHTFGKGTVQTLLPLGPELGAIKVTVGMFFLPGGASTQQRGVPADIALPTLYDSSDLSEAKLDNSLPPQNVPAFTSKDANGSAAQRWAPVTSGEVSALLAQSKARRAADPGFAKLQAKIAELKDKGVVKLAELRKKDIAAKGKDAKASAAAKDKDEDETKSLEAVVLKEAVNIAADEIALANRGNIAANKSGARAE